MGRKIFVSYKHEDDSVLKHGTAGTARDYVDDLIDIFEEDREIYKGEGDEDLREFKDETKKNRLKEKIHDSSITIVLISPKMKEKNKAEKDQFIPWEIAYSLKEIERNNKKSHPNAVLAVVLPDKYGNYSYFIEEHTCQYCNARLLKTDTLFQILANNMFNKIDKTFSDCNHCNSYIDEPSYILSVKWENFIEDKDHYLERAVDIRDNRKSYNITKEI